MADGEILFKAGMDTAGFESGSRRIKQSADSTADSVKSAFSSIGNIIAGGAFVSGLENLLSKMDRVQTLATRFGTSAEAVQRIGGAADQVGTSLEDVARAMTKAGIAAAKAANDGSEAWKNIGIDAAAFAAGDLETKVNLVAAAMQSVGGDQRKMAELFDVIGAKAAGINFAELVTEMQNVNVASNELVKQLADANDMLDRMKNNATVLGANLLKALVVDPAERLGNIVSGGPGRTNAEVSDKELTDRATDRANREQLLDPSGDYEGGMGEVSGIIRPNEAMVKNLEIIAALKREILAEEEQITIQTVATAAAVETVADKTKARAEAAEHIRELALEIKEAENAGNDVLAEKLRWQKDYETALESNLDSEDAYGMAVREANANLEARNKLLAEQLQHTHDNVEAELKYAETMAYGTAEEKSRAEWMKIYNEAKSKPGVTEDQAQRAANVGTYKPEKDKSSEGGGGGGGGRGGSDEYEWNDTISQDEAEMRSRGRTKRARDRADELESRGYYDAAARIRKRADEKSKEIIEDARLKDRQKRMAEEGSSEDPSQPGGGKGKGGGGGDEGQGALLRKVSEIYTYISTKMPANSLT